MANVTGDESNNNLIGTSFDDTVTGLGGSDYLDGGQGGNDSLDGGAGDDVLNGWNGNDTLLGGAGDDYLIAGGERDGGSDLVNGGEGQDIVAYNYEGRTTAVVFNATGASGTQVDPAGGTDTLVSIEEFDVYGGEAGDTITGDAMQNIFFGNGGNDTLTGGVGRDSFGYMTTMANGIDRITDFGAGDDISIENGEEGPGAAWLNESILGGGDGSGLLQGQVMIGTPSNGVTLVYIGTDSVAGADIVIELAGSFTASNFGVFNDDWGAALFYNVPTEGDDNLGGTWNNDGNDSIDGLGGNDYMDGRDGNDTLQGGAGNDTIAGDFGNDSLLGGDGDDEIHGEEGADTINGGAGYDTILGGYGNDSLLGGGDDDEIYGDEGADTLNGGAGNDFLDGGAITDTINYFDLNWVRFEGATTGVVVNLQAGTAQDGQGGTDTLVNINWVSGTQYADSITGADSALFEQFEGLGGNDTLDGGAAAGGITARASYVSATTGINVNLGTGIATDGLGGTDTLVRISHIRAGAHNDTLTGSNTTAYTESFDGQGGSDTIDGLGGIDEYRVDGSTTGAVINLETGQAQDGQGGTDTLANIENARGGSWNDTLIGSDGNNLLRGQGGHDLLNGAGGNDTLQGGDGADTLNGGAGNDTLDGGVIVDTFNYTDGNWVSYANGGMTSGAVINLATGTAQDGFGGTDTLLNINFVTGSAHNDSITGANNAIFEMFDGGAGNDTLDGGAFVQGSGARAAYQSATTGVSVTLGGTAAGSASDGLGGTDTLLNIQQVRGSNHNDVLTGSDTTAWVETFEGRGGNDTINGMGGADEYRLMDNLPGGVGGMVDLTAGTADDGQGGVDTLSNIENVRGSHGNDVITGNALGNLLRGQGGTDQLNGEGGNDTLQGGDGNDTMMGGAGDDYFNAGAGEAGDDTMDGGEGHDIVSYNLQTVGSGGQVFYVATGGMTQWDTVGGQDTLLNIEEVHVYGSAGNDTINGNELRNWIHGTGGNDTLTGAGGYDTFSYTAGQASGTDRITDFGVGGDNIQIQNVVLGTTVLSGDDASGLAQGQVMVGSTVNGTTRVYIGTDGAAGSDITIELAGSYSAANFTAGNDQWGGNITYSAPPSGAPTEGNDNLTGTPDADFLDGMGGDDTIDGMGGNDHLQGNFGNDLIRGSAGDDMLQGQQGNDTLDGGEGNDIAGYGLFGTTAGTTFTSTLATGAQADGLGGVDTLSSIEELHVWGGLGADSITGGAERNWFEGNEGNDTLTGSAGMDAFAFQIGAMPLGQDRITDLQAGEYLHFRFLELNSVTAGNGTSVGMGQVQIGAYNAGTNTTQVFVGTDSVAGADLVVDLTGNYAAGDFNVFNWQGNGNLNYTPGINQVGTPGNDTLGGTDSNDTLSGLGGNDNFWGGAGNDVILGGDGDDFMQGAAGNDTLDGGNGTGDMAGYSDATSGVTVNLQAGTATGGSGTDSLQNIENIGGSLYNDTLTGSAANNYIDGNLGNDFIDGGAGTDMAGYVNATGAVTVDLATGSATGAAGNDTLTGIENVGGSDYNDLLTGDNNNNSLLGNGGNDTLVGNGGVDFLDGGAGNDSMSGGAARDNFVGSAGNDTMDGGAITERIGYSDLNSVSYANSATTGIVVNLQTGVVQDGQGGVDQLTNINFVTGSNHNDSFLGSTETNLFEQFEGGLGDDTIDGGAIDAANTNANRVTYQNASGAVTVNLALGTATGAQGNDTLINISQATGSSHADTLIGSNSAIAEVFEARGGNDTIDGAGGIDFARYDGSTAAVTANLATGTASDGWGGTDTLQNIEGLRGSAFGDVLTGGNAANDAVEIFMGNGGNDTIDGGSGYDRAQYDSSTAAVTVTLGGNGDGTASDGFGGTDTLRNIEGARGSAFNDVLNGSANGGETFEGRGGNDTINGGGGFDTAIFSGTRASFTLTFGSGQVSVQGGGETDVVSNVERLAFSDGNVYLYDNALFDTLRYVASNTDLIGAFGTNADTAAQHYFYTGSLEGRGTTTFDAWRYLASNVDLLTTFGPHTPEATLHFVEHGFAEGRSSSAFDANLYLASNTDVLASVGADLSAAAQHYVTTGYSQGRGFQFDGLRYIASNADLITAFRGDAAAGAAHYVNSGFSEGRQVATFNGLNYIASNADLIGAFGTDARSATLHYVYNGFDEGRRVTFDADQYLAMNTDVLVAYGQDADTATTHYITNGYNEGRATSGFDGLRYIASHADLIAQYGADAEAGTAHFVHGGYQFGYRVTFDALAYVASHADLMATYGTDTQAATYHYVTFGFNEYRAVSFDWLQYALANTDLLGVYGYDQAGMTSHYIQWGHNEGRQSALNALTGGSANDVFAGGDDANYLTGSWGNDTIAGNGGNDLFVGGHGADSLSGGSGTDVFVYQNTNEGGDTIADFASGTDKLAFKSAAFGDLDLGTLDAGHFAATSEGLGGRAGFVYDAATGTLSYDADGAGAAGAVGIAALGAGHVLAANDILIVG